MWALRYHVSSSAAGTFSDCFHESDIAGDGK